MRGLGNKGDGFNPAAAFLQNRPAVQLSGYRERPHDGEGLRVQFQNVLRTLDGHVQQTAGRIVGDSFQVALLQPGRPQERALRVHLAHVAFVAYNEERATERVIADSRGLREADSVDVPRALLCRQRVGCCWLLSGAGTRTGGGQDEQANEYLACV